MSWYVPDNGFAEKTEAVQRAYAKMPKAEQAQVDLAVKNLLKRKYKNLGEGMALEILGKVGMWLEDR